MKPLLLALLLAAAPASAAPIAITGATILTARGETMIEDGTLIFDNGRITAIGQQLPVPAGATVIDGRGRVLTPGIIAAASDLGISEVGGVRETNDSAARASAFSAALDVSTAINPRSLHIAISRMAGVTRAAALPDAGNSIFAGQGALISLGVAGPTLTRARDPICGDGRNRRAHRWRVAPGGLGAIGQHAGRSAAVGAQSGWF